MPIFRYFVSVGGVLLALLFALSEGDVASVRTTVDTWTAADSLRAMAHHGERNHSTNTRPVIYYNP
jgi:hypothetical protein